MKPVVLAPVSWVLTLDDWHPSLSRGREGHEAPPPVDYDCPCNDCVLRTPEERRKAAHEEWRRGGYVEVRLWCFDPMPKPPHYQSRISFWGADDTGMEKHFVYEEDARWFLCHLPVFVTKEWLRSQGFVYC